MKQFNSTIAMLFFVFTQVVSAKPEPFNKVGGQHHFLKLFDSNADGSVTEIEFNTIMQERYQLMDKDHNGTVSLGEIKNYSTKRHQDRQHKKHNKMDLNNDGLISKQEFIKHATKHAEKKFNQLDKNLDGQLSQEENMDKHARKKQRLLNKMDVNNDGLISKDEHNRMTQQWFKKFDTNNDQVVSKDELKGWLHK